MRPWVEQVYGLLAGGGEQVRRALG
jgi:hypothetical protein